MRVVLLGSPGGTSPFGFRDQRSPSALSRGSARRAPGAARARAARPPRSGSPATGAGGGVSLERGPSGPTSWPRRRCRAFRDAGLGDARCARAAIARRGDLSTTSRQRHHEPMKTPPRRRPRRQPQPRLSRRQPRAAPPPAAVPTASGASPPHPAVTGRMRASPVLTARAT